FSARASSCARTTTWRARSVNRSNNPDNPFLPGPRTSFPRARRQGQEPCYPTCRGRQTRPGGRAGAPRGGLAAASSRAGAGSARAVAREPGGVPADPGCTLPPVDEAGERRTKALVTGGAGFIGAHLCELLLDEGAEVYALDDLSTGSLDNVERLRRHDAFHLVVDSVLKEAVVNELVHKCDVVYHLAAAVGVRLIVEQPVHTMVTNVQGTETVLDCCSRFGKRVLIASIF